jgi:hypothetical protein
MIAELLNQFEPEPDGLLHEISRQIDDQMLESIAAADYGGSGQEEHLAALRQIRDTGTFPKEICWYPAEVLELIRNSNPEDHNHKPGAIGPFGHWIRAFSCAALLRASREPYNYLGDPAPDYSLIQLIHSLRVLPVDFSPQATRFLAWLLLHSDPEGRDEDVCAYGIGLFWFALQLSTFVPDETFVLLAEWIVRRVKEHYAHSFSPEYSFPPRMGVGNPPPSPWQSLGGLLFDLDLSGRSPELREWVKFIGLELAD